ncbi:tripartite motif-containing protein 16-like isoform X2 [Pygocentrus nattereri]|uniref:Tripartite motif-containing protein 16-like n=1 Tax=Pygocentrus nattereri TaxID=42514 RepID=A0AAR2M5F1_PYGNA|nr:tripartite motif-containing protein 16-like isoform X2 [Pygocentrus nattereri]
MADALLTSQDSFNCPICLDLLKDPVTIPCGHSYCLVCIEGCWAEDDQRGTYNCPQCRHSFTPRPVLNKNTMLAELAEGLRKTRFRATPPPWSPADSAAGSPAGSGDVECDVCTGSKPKAVKSCLVCLLSFCEAHIQPHYESPAYKKHKLVEASMNLQEKICSQHDKLLEIFCRTDQTFLCYLCTMDEHKGHDTVSASAERTEKRTQLVGIQKELQQGIQQREKKLHELRQALDTLRRSAQAAVEDSEKIFTELIESIERRRSEVKELIRAQEKTELSQAEDLLKKLEQEIADLRRRDAELEQLSHSEDHIHFLQSFQALSSHRGTTDLPSINVDPHFSFEDIRKAMAEMKDRIEDTYEKEVKKISRVTKIQTVLVPDPKTREEFLLYACDLTLDPNTVCWYLRLSEENKKVMLCNTKELQDHPDHPERFRLCGQVLCREGLSGRCYWEAEWRRNYEANIAVAYKGIDRKECNINRFGGSDQSWCLTCTYYNCCSHKVGVYLDHRAGTLAFYNVSDTMTLIHRIQTTFTEPLYPGFGLWGRGNSLQICNFD